MGNMEVISSLVRDLRSLSTLVTVCYYLPEYRPTPFFECLRLQKC